MKVFSRVLGGGTCLMDKLYLYNPIAVQCSLSLMPVTRDCEISVELDQVTFFFF